MGPAGDRLVKLSRRAGGNVCGDRRLRFQGFGFRPEDREVRA